MKIEAIRYFLKGDNLENLLVELSCDHGDQLLSAKKENILNLYLVESKNLTPFRQYSEIVIDRGVKGKKIALSRYLLNHKKIPLLESSSNRPVQLPRSIRDFIRIARKRKDRNIYILGACDEVFAELKGKATASSEWLAEFDSFEPGGEIDWAGHGNRPGTLTTTLSDNDEDGFKAGFQVEKIFLGTSLQAQKVRYFITCAAKSDDEVLILGETGTGKEVVAKAIHKLRFKGRKEMQVINCSAISPNLLESELFGYKKGAFTGAGKDKKGLWELANDSTLFLDEIGDLSLQHQAKILRALSDKKIRPVGSDRQVHVNARVVSATNVDLVAKVKNKEFRDDLFYRLNTFPIFVPPLRDRKEDICVLANSFWHEIISGNGAPLKNEVLLELQKRDWPGNVRVLHSFLRCLRNLNYEKIKQGKILTTSDINFAFAYHGQHHFLPDQNQADKDSVLLHPANCLRRLKRVSDILFSIKLAMPPLLEGSAIKNKSCDSIMNNIQDLKMLCRDDPSLFHSVPTLNVIWRFVSRMRKLRELLKTDMKEANSFWIKELSDELTHAMETVFAEIAKIAV